MIKLLHSLPKKLTVAFSGGVDSVAALDFLSNNHQVDAAFFHHGTDASDHAWDFVTEFCKSREIPLTVGYIKNIKPSDQSWEEHWRNERYQFLDQFEYVVTAHHLNDCVETYIWSMLNGDAKLIPAQRNNVRRPFLLTSKVEFVDWCNRKNLKWVEDRSNQDNKYIRNYIRNQLMPHAVHVNPGLEKVIFKKVKEAYHNSK